MAVQLLNAATSTGTSNSWTIRRGAIEHTVQATVTGSPTAVQIDLEGSLDGTTWYKLAAHNFSAGDISNQNTMFHVSSKMVTYVRVNVISLTGGSSPTITVLYDWHRDY